MRRILPLLFAAALLLCACSGPVREAPPTAAADEYPSVPAARQTAQPAKWRDDGLFTLRCVAGDTLNPYACSTENNRLLSSLLYENLVGVSPEFSPEPALCAQWTTEDGGYSFELILREGARFSDGSEVRGWDVIYSINRAKESSSFYEERLRSVAGVGLSGSGVLITLSAPQPGFPALLDIPVVKEGSAYRDQPTGSGPYMLQEDESGLYLSGNPYHPDCGSLPFQRIELRDFASDSLIGAFSSGSLDFLISDPGVTVMPGLEGAVRRSVPTTVLHYLALNPASEQFSDPARRRLVNAVISRGSLSGILGGDAALLPLHPLLPYYDEGAAKAWLPTDIESYCIEILTEDYNGDGRLEYFRDGVPTDFTFRLLVCSGSDTATAAARSIMEDLDRVGIGAELRMLNSEEFLRAVGRRDYDAYLASMRLTADFDLTALYRNPGDDLLQRLAGDYISASEAEKSAAASELCAYSTESSCVIPLIFERRVYYRRPGGVREIAPTWTDPFRNIADWTIEDETEEES
ncbi:MAG: hypothetical protein IKD79_01970 [Oscillospiraceae bacterium]|nr:hypothetical protein [Oscillospiraceae bacterium]